MTKVPTKLNKGTGRPETVRRTRGRRVWQSEEEKKRDYDDSDAFDDPGQGGDFLRDQGLDEEKRRQEIERRSKAQEGREATPRKAAGKQTAKAGAGSKTQRARDKELEKVAETAHPSDGLEAENRQALESKAQRLGDFVPKPDPATKPKARRARENDPMSAMDNAQDPGVYFRQRRTAGEGGVGGESDGQSEEDIALMEAVREARTLLADVKGISDIGPGVNDAGTPVILISVAKGFSRVGFGKIPPEVRSFATLLALPFDILPLKREDALKNL